jgi:hypothetical protein
MPTENKLTKHELFWLKELAGASLPCDWRYHRKSIGNRFVKFGLATFNYGYPCGFVITEAGRAALNTQGGDNAAD